MPQWGSRDTYGIMREWEGGGNRRNELAWLRVEWAATGSRSSASLLPRQLLGPGEYQP